MNANASEPIADLNARDYKGKTAVMLAIESGDTTKVKALISDGADVNAADDEGCTPLMSAAHRGDPCIIRMLISAGANVNTKAPSTAFTALMGAAFMSHAACVKALIEAKANVIAKDDHGRTALEMAVNRADIESVKALIAAGANVNETNDRGRPVLMATNNPETMKTLINAGARPEGELTSALMEVAGWGPAEAVKLLICAGADVNARDRGGMTPLICAAGTDNIEKVEALIVAGANVADFTSKIALRRIAARYLPSHISDRG